MSALTLSMCALPSRRGILPGYEVTGAEFLIGVNYPWIAYGHDVGENAWGHDGLITSGWTYQTWRDSQGFTDTRRSTEKACTGVASLCITADLVGQDPNKSCGEVYIDLRNHRPPWKEKGACGFVDAPVNLKGVTVRCCVLLPNGSAGEWASAPNGVQLFFKSEGWWSWYSEWKNIQPEWEERWVEFTVNLSEPPGYKDLLFDPTKVIAVGLKVAINDKSTAKLQGVIYLDNYMLETNPPIAFDFEQLEVERDFITVKEVLKKCSKRVVRMFVFADGRASPDFTPDGAVAGLSEYFFPRPRRVIKGRHTARPLTYSGLTRLHVVQQTEGGGWRATRRPFRYHPRPYETANILGSGPQTLGGKVPKQSPDPSLGCDQ